jgi:hypothetical protein
MIFDLYFPENTHIIPKHIQKSIKYAKYWMILKTIYKIWAIPLNTVFA